MAKCYIIAGGDFDGFADEIKNDDLLIAADKGYTYAKSLDIKPDIIIGDFDSSKRPDLKNVVKLNPIKDFTDTKAAIIEGIKRGYKDFVIYGALGGDRDSHTIANIRILLEYKKQGIDIKLKSNKKEVFIINDEYSYKFKDKEDDFYVSVFAMSDMVKGLSIKGLYYELEDYDMDLSDNLGVSNESSGKDFSIKLKEGYLLIIIEKNRG